MNTLSLFSGIGGLDLAAEWAGFTPIAFCEQEDFCRAVLAHHWPGVYCFDDVRSLTIESLRAAGIAPGDIDAIIGGFPCQQVSNAGQGEGLGTEDAPTDRSGLWFQFLRLVRDIRPKVVVAENVPGLRTRGIDTVLAGLEEAGYTAGAFVVGSWAVGAPHKRDRVFILAHTCSGTGRAGTERLRREARSDAGRRGAGSGMGVGDSDGSGAVSRSELCQSHESQLQVTAYDGSGMANALSAGWASDGPSRAKEQDGRNAHACPSGDRTRAIGVAQGNPDGAGQPRTYQPCEGQRETDECGADIDAGSTDQERGTDRATEPRMGSAAYGLSRRMDGHTVHTRPQEIRWPSGRGEAQQEWEAPRTAHRAPGRPSNRQRQLKALGNAVNPHQAYPILVAAANLFTTQGCTACSA